MIEIGSIAIDIVSDGLFALDGGAMFGVVPKTLWQKVAKVDKENRLLLGLNCLLIWTKHKTILVDVGLGTKLSPKMRRILAVDRTEELESSIKKHLSPEEIDMVILTHLHFDHIGGLYRKNKGGKLVPNFPNAQIVVQADEYKAAFLPDDRTIGSYDQENFAPLKDSPSLVLVKGNKSICRGVRVIKTGGHTPGHQIVQVSSQGKTLVFWGDLIPTSYHLKIPYISAYDIDPQTTVKQKKTLLEQAAAEQWLCLFEHNPKRRLGYIEKTVDENRRIKYRLRRYLG
ncbi:MAG: MBL fold metallo-hydrolase [bacterium]